MRPAVLLAVLQIVISCIFTSHGHCCKYAFRQPFNCRGAFQIHNQPAVYTTSLEKSSRPHGRIAQSLDRISYVHSGPQFASALADPTVSVVSLVAPLVNVSFEDWAAAAPGGELPVLVNRNVSIEGDPGNWPQLNMNNIRAVVRLAAYIRVEIHYVVLDGARDNPTRLPGLDILAPTLAGPPSEVLIQSCALTAPACFPSSFQTLDVNLVSRPSQYPGTQEIRWNVSQAGCLPGRSVPAMQRCWTDKAVVVDMVVEGMDANQRTGVFLPTNTLYLLKNITALCAVHVDMSCLKRAEPLVCFEDTVKLSRSGAFGGADGTYSPAPSPNTASSTPPPAGASSGSQNANLHEVQTGPATASRSTAIAAGSAIAGVVVLLAVLTLAVIVIVRRRRLQQQQRRVAGFSTRVCGVNAFGNSAATTVVVRSGGSSASTSCPIGQPLDITPFGVGGGGGKGTPCQELRDDTISVFLQDASSALPPSDSVETGTGTLVGTSSATTPVPSAGDVSKVLRSAAPAGAYDLFILPPVTPLTPPRPSLQLHVRLLAPPKGVDRGQGCQGEGQHEQQMWLRSPTDAMAGVATTTTGEKEAPALAGESFFPAGADGRPTGGDGHHCGLASGGGDDTRQHTHPGPPTFEPDNCKAPAVHGQARDCNVQIGTTDAAGCGQSASAVVELSHVVRGKGAFGRVVEGVYGGQRVAVKIMATGEPWGPGANSTATAETTFTRTFAQELEVLSRCAHPNIVRLLAACVTPPRPCLVMELMETSLDKLIHCHPNPNEITLLPLTKVLYIGICIARALDYLHPTIMHRDLKPANVLINNAGRDKPIVKLTDFGLSRLRMTVAYTEHPDAGTPPYMAPECFDLRDNRISHKSDIYSLGVLLWEMLTASTPWENTGAVAVAFLVTYRKCRLPLGHLAPDRCPPKLARLLQACWDAEPARRPAAAEVAKEMALVLQMLAQSGAGTTSDDQFTQTACGGDTFEAEDMHKNNHIRGAKAPALDAGAGAGAGAGTGASASACAGAGAGLAAGATKWT